MHPLMAEVENPRKTDPGEELVKECKADRWQGSLWVAQELQMLKLHI